MGDCNAKALSWQYFAKIKPLAELQRARYLSGQPLPGDADVAAVAFKKGGKTSGQKELFDFLPAHHTL